MVHAVQKAPKLAGVVGDPIAQSLSPVIHNEWCRRAGLDGLYLPIRVVGDQQRFSIAMTGLRKAGFAGVNVTMPHKGHALEFADQLTTTARNCRAANMLTFGDGATLGDSSDGIGFITALKSALGNAQAIRSALVLGAGGASGAICHALLEYGLSKLLICNRTSAKAESLAAQLTKFAKANQTIETVDWRRRDDCACELVVNTTALGMAGMARLNFHPNPALGHRAIADIVYKPLETGLLKQARAAGLATINGLDMLMHQAVPGFEQWFGGKAMVDQSLRQLLLDHIDHTVKKPFLTIGLTGSIGMGKSTVAKMFAEEGCAVWDADEAVHRLYAKGGIGVAALKTDFPYAIIDGAVDRGRLGAQVLADAKKMEILESIIHPLVAVDRAMFLRDLEKSSVKICVLDIPLLFEGDMASAFDHIVVVSAAPDTQKKRVLERPAMTEEKFNAIVARQMPDEQKRQLADYIVATDVSLSATRARVAALVAEWQG